MNSENITVNVENTAPCQVKVTVTVAQTAIVALKAQIIKEFQGQVQIPGFRKGKAPKNMVEKAYAAHIASELQERVTKMGYEQAFSNNPTVQPVGYPKMTEGTFSEGADYTFVLDFDVEPTFELGDYKSIRIEKTEVSVSEEEVAEALANLQERQKRIEKSETAEAKVGDMLKLSYEGKIAGEEDLSNRLLKAEESWMLVDEPEMIPGAKTFLVGAKAGVTIEATVNFPADFHEAELAGKTANYKFDVIEVHTSIIPEIDEEFAKGLGLEGVEDLKTKITDSLIHGKEQAEAGKLQEAALKAALALAGDFAVSATQIAEEVKTLQEDAANAEKTEEELFANAKERVQSFYYLIKLAKEENVQITMQDMENRLQTMSYYSRKSPKLLQKELVKDGRINGVAMDVTLDKTIRRLADIVTGKDTSAE